MNSAERGMIGHNSKPTREEIEASFRQRTRDQRIKDNTPFDLRWQWEVWLSDLPANGKLIALAIRMFAPATGAASTPSIETLIQMTGLSRQTVVTQLKTIEKALLVEITRGKGRASSSYALVIPTHTLDEIAKVIDIRNGQAIRPLDGRSSQTTRPQEASVAVKPLDRENRSSLIGDRSSLPAVPNLTRDLTLEEERGKAPSQNPVGKVAAALAAGIAAMTMPAAADTVPAEQVQDAPAACWQTPKAKMAAATNAITARLQRQIWLTPTGRVEVAGDLRAELVRDYPLVDLKCGLSAAAVNVRPDSGVLNCIQTVHRQFAYMQTDAEQRAKRAAARQHAPISETDRKPPEMPQIVWDKIQRDKAAKRAAL